MSSNSVTIFINFPERVFMLNATPSEDSSILPSNLYFESISSTNSHSSIRQPGFQKNFKAFLNPSEGHINSQLFEDLVQDLIKTSKMIKASNLHNLDLIYLLVPFNSSLVVGMYEVKIQDIMLNNIEEYCSYIQELNHSAHDTEVLSLKACHRIKEIEAKQKEFDVSCKRMEDHCTEIKKQIDGLSLEIRLKHSMFVSEGDKFEQFECMICKTNRRDVIFLPCGHVIYCSHCLKEDFKLIVDFPVKHSKLLCDKCKRKVKKTLQIIL